MMIRWTGLAPWEFVFPFPGSLTSTFLGMHLTPDRYTLKQMASKERSDAQKVVQDTLKPRVE